MTHAPKMPVPPFYQIVLVSCVSVDLAWRLSTKFGRCLQARILLTLAIKFENRIYKSSRSRENYNARINTKLSNVRRVRMELPKSWLDLVCVLSKPLVAQSSLLPHKSFSVERTFSEPRVITV